MSKASGSHPGREVIFRPLRPDELGRAGAQIAESYKTAYAGMMDQTYLNSLDDKHWVPILESSLKRGDCCIIAEVDGQIAGTTVYGKSETSPDTADWHAIYLAPRAIGQGLGHKLYTHMEEAMRGQGFTACTLEVLTQNHRAISFYQKHGYSVTSTFVVSENGMELECHGMKKNL